MKNFENANQANYYLGKALKELKGITSTNESIDRIAGMMDEKIEKIQLELETLKV